MVESIRNRVARMIVGNVHSLIDALENASPEAGMAQAIREIDGVIDEVGAGLGRVAATRHLALTRLTDQNRRHEALSGEIEVAIQEGCDDLAKAAIAKQMDIEAQRSVLEQALAHSTAEEKEMEEYAIALRAKKREMEDSLRQYLVSNAEKNGALGAPKSTGTGTGVEAKVARAESAFDRILTRQTGLPGGAAQESADAAKLRELSELARRNRVEERLAVLKETR